MERPRAGKRNCVPMTSASKLRSGKTHRDENFPVASRLIHPRHRPLILAFYEFVRTADDIADHASLGDKEKLGLLDRLEADLLGASADNPEAVTLRTALARRDLSPRHAQDLLTAFRLDVTKRRYRDWDDLMHYCAHSAMPVGRFVLDVHGESRATWPVSDAVCAALQIINHLQDCGEDYRNLNRVYVPLDALASVGLGVEALGETKASPALRRCLHGLAERTEQLLSDGQTLPLLIKDLRLGLEISVIYALAHRLTHILAARDPLSEPSHLSAAGVAGISMMAVLKGTSRRLARRLAAGFHKPRDAGAPVPEAELPTTEPARSASGSSFYTAMRILPRQKREAMFEIYSFCRAVDDIADDTGPRGERLVQLQHWRDLINNLYAGTAPLQLRGLARAIREFDLRQEDFFSVIDGMETDIVADIRAPDLATLDLYCDRVAGAVGRLSVRIFGMEPTAGLALAHHLGRALQLTNILRDLDEDAAIGRLYLAGEALREAGITTTDPISAISNPAIEKACRPLVDMARSHFVEAEKIMARCPRRIVRAPKIMAEAYKSILDRLVARGWSSPREAVRVPRWLFFWIILRHAVV